ncbi:hypothetical protein GCM10023170_085460 [Phytohabitans houttuyneae]|uniref:Uncharacterized protein n=1 Tax=Phytohabitans houttuyneae TaxID=1076126 RepID=A0A6V8KQH2_9ACTN|nr:hypothetical protein Phou_090280 [Phytohabitans houttuyneae]
MHRKQALQTARPEPKISSGCVDECLLGDENLKHRLSGRECPRMLGITCTYRTMFIPERGFAVYLSAPFKTVRAYMYGPDVRLQPASGTR